MEVVIKNCNNIDHAKFALQPKRLNIKYGPNGIGKSTLARAIALSLEDGGTKLTRLLPFKYSRDSSPEKQPSVSGVEEMHTVMIFGEDYVNQFVFQRDEIVKNSFDIFIRNADYDQKMAEIEAMVVEIREAFSKNETIDQVIRDLQELGDSFGKSQSGYSKAGRLSKGLGGGNKIEHVPEKLNGYSHFIQSSKNVSWIKWQIEGKEFLDLSTSCPFCTAPTDDNRDTILAVGKEYDAKSIEHLLSVQGTIARLGEYFSADAKQKVTEIVKNKTGLGKEEIAYLIGIKAETDALRGKLSDVKNISFFSLRDATKVKETIAAFKIDLSLLPRLQSEATATIVGQVNDCLNSLLVKAGKLEGEINKQKDSIERTIKRYKGEINTFLRFAGYRYAVNIEPEETKYKMKLRHVDSNEYIESGGLHLSYGEKNAFSIVLFMYECLTKKPDLVVLDDPISSFDKTKKFAILETLFRGKESLQAKTVLMLTHDIEPVIDLIKTLSHTFQPIPTASFLTSTGGDIKEVAISKADVLSFVQVCADNIAKLTESTIQIIYLRRKYQILDDKSDEYNLLSSLLHKRPQPTTTKEGTERTMTAAEIGTATAGITSFLPAFNYAKILAKINDKNSIMALYQATNNRYEKLQLFRLMNEGHDFGQVDDVVRKYIHETFHIENEYVMQLNPHIYDSVPEYIVKECDHLLGLQQVV